VYLILMLNHKFTANYGICLQINGKTEEDNKDLFASILKVLGANDCGI